MTDAAAIEEQAVLYVFGELSPEEREAFELCLEASPELKSLVVDLQSGTEALARAVPQQPLPSGLWSVIEKAVANERKVVAVSFRRPRFWIGWAAVACFSGWLLHGVWSGRSVKSSETAIAQTAPLNAAASKSAGRSFPANAQPQKEPSVHSAAAERTASSPDPLNVRITALEERMTEISQTLTQRPAKASVGLDGIRYFQQSTSGGSSGDGTLVLTPGLQHALVLALARELARQQPGGDGLQGGRSLATENGLGADFLDLVPVARGQTSNAPPAELKAQAQFAGDGATGNERVASTGTGGLVGFISGDRAVMIVDAGSVPAGDDSVAFTGHSVTGMETSFGSVPFHGYPLIVSVPVDGLTAPGDVLYVTAGSTSELGLPPVVIGVVPTTGSNPP
jgi:hypothetical protein